MIGAKLSPEEEDEENDKGQSLRGLEQSLRVTGSGRSEFRDYNRVGPREQIDKGVAKEER